MYVHMEIKWPGAKPRGAETAGAKRQGRNSESETAGAKRSG